MIPRPFAAASLLALLLPALSTAANESSLCPENIETSQAPKTVPSGWQAMPQPGSTPLSNASFYDGHPDQQAELAPEKSKTSRTQFVNTWRFSSLHNEAVWIKCQYADTYIALTRKLAADTTACTITYDRHYSPPAITGIDCK